MASRGGHGQQAWQFGGAVEKMMGEQPLVERIVDVERGLFSGSRALPIIEYDITVLDYHR